MERRTLTVHLPRRRLTIALVVLVAAAVLVPTAMAVGGRFTDDDTSIFEADIEWLAETGVTRGCNPPANDRFCPEQNVTRGQMAAFMRRFARFLGAEDGGVDHADHAGFAEAAGFAETAEQAGNADTLDGRHASDFPAVIRVDASLPLGDLEDGVTLVELGGSRFDFTCIDETADDDEPPTGDPGEAQGGLYVYAGDRVDFAEFSTLGSAYGYQRLDPGSILRVSWTSDTGDPNDVHPVFFWASVPGAGTVQAWLYGRTGDAYTDHCEMIGTLILSGA